MAASSSGSVARSGGAPPGPIKVAHVVLALNMGGLERVVLRLLARLDRARFAPIVCALDEPGGLAPDLARLGIPLRVIRRGPGVDLGVAVRLARALREEGVRLVHTHNAASHLYGSLAAHLLRLRTGRRPPIVHTKHGRDEPDKPRRVLVNRLASALCDRVVAVSDDAASVAIRIEHVDPGKVMTILNGVDTDEFRPRTVEDALAARAALGVPPGGFHVGTVARLAAIKDQRTMLDGFARLRAARPDAHLTLVGGGPERAALEGRAALPDLAGAVTFGGERADIAPLLAAFDVFALSSLSEGISLTLLEASSAGLPIVATRVGGNAEVVVDGETGLLVPAADPAAFGAALADMAGRPDRAALGVAGRARVERLFSVQRMVRDYTRLYTELLGTG